MEHLMHAQTSRDLSDAVEGFADVDWLRAAGAVGQRHGFALSLWRMVWLRDRRALARVHGEALALAVRCSGDDDPIEAVTAVLAYMLDPVCHVCEGRSFARFAGTPHLSDAACEACGGSGRRVPQWGPRASKLYETMRSMQRDAASALVRKLR